MKTEIKKNLLITEEMILQRYFKNQPTRLKQGERPVREVLRLLKEYLKETIKDGATKVRLSKDLEIFSDIYLKASNQEYEGEELQYYMNSLYCDEVNRYDEDHLMGNKYREKNLKEIKEDVEEFFKNPPFKNKKTKKQ